LKWIGTADGARTLPTLVGGYGSNAFYMSEPRVIRGPSDSSYQTALSGTTYLTELQRDPHVIKDIEKVDLYTVSCSADRTVTVGISIDVGAYVDFAAITSNGYQELTAASGGVPTATLLGGRTLKPRIVYASNTSAISPKVQGWIKVRYRTRPEMVNAYQFTIELNDDPVQGDAEAQQDKLLTEWSSGPVLVGNDPGDVDSYYIRVDSVKVREVADTGGEKSSSRGSIRVADVVGTQWSTS
jgi:hypothetical protein